MLSPLKKVLEPARWYRCTADEKVVCSARVGAEMGIATDILNLRSSQFSSVTTLMAAIDRFLEAPEGKGHFRLFQLEEATDIALTNIAAHAAEAMTALQPNSGRMARAISVRRTRHRFDSGPSTSQRSLFATATRFVS